MTTLPRRCYGSNGIHITAEEASALRKWAVDSAKDEDGILTAAIDGAFKVVEAIAERVNALHIYTNGEDWLVAISCEHAKELADGYYKTMMNEEAFAERKPALSVFVVEPDNKVLKIGYGTELVLSYEAQLGVSSDEAVLKAMASKGASCKTWANLMPFFGFLCSRGC